MLSFLRSWRCRLPFFLRIFDKPDGIGKALQSLEVLLLDWQVTREPHAATGYDARVIRPPR